MEGVLSSERLSPELRLLTARLRETKTQVVFLVVVFMGFCFVAFYLQAAVLLYLFSSIVCLLLGYSISSAVTMNLIRKLSQISEAVKQEKAA